MTAAITTVQVQALASWLRALQGEPVGILCCRYWWRGIVAEVGDDAVKLTNCSMVEITGVAANAAPESEDPYPSDMVLALGAVESYGQPGWCFHNMEEAKESGR